MDMFAGKTWLIYGKIGMPKKDTKEAITSRGGRVVSSVSKKLNYLVWDGDTLVPGDEVTSVKPQALLAQGGLAVSSDDFMALLEGKVSEKIQGYLSQQTASSAADETATKKPAKKKPTTKKASSKKTASLTSEAITPAALLERSRAGLEATPLTSLPTVEKVIAAAVEAGEAKVAEDIARALPEALQGYGLMAAAAFSGNGTLASEASERLVAAYGELPAWQKDKHAPHLARVTHLAGLGAEVKDARAQAEGAISAAVEDDAYFTLNDILAAWVSSGAHAEVRALVGRIQKKPDLFSQIDLRPSVVAFASDLSALRELLPALSVGDRFQALEDPRTVAVATQWSV